MRGLAVCYGIVTMAALLGSCATLQRREAQQMETILSAAGFQQKPADTTDKVAHLAGLTPDKVVSFVKDGKRVYAYADPTGCHCLLVGDEAAYQRYQKLANAPQIAEEQGIAAKVNEEDADDAGTSWEYADGPLWW
jgi:uncharacterized ParB-like nuclease family protein